MTTPLKPRKLNNVAFMYALLTCIIKIKVTLYNIEDHGDIYSNVLSILWHTRNSYIEGYWIVITRMILPNTIATIAEI